MLTNGSDSLKWFSDIINSIKHSLPKMTDVLLSITVMISIIYSLLSVKSNRPAYTIKNHTSITNSKWCLVYNRLMQCLYLTWLITRWRNTFIKKIRVRGETSAERVSWNLIVVLLYYQISMRDLMLWDVKAPFWKHLLILPSYSCYNKAST